MKPIRLVVAVLVALVICGTGIALGASGALESQDAANTEAQSLSEEPSPPEGVEVKSARTETSRTYALPSGASETRIYANPINYQGGNGAWAPIDEGLEQLESGKIVSGSNRFDAELPVRLGKGAVRLAIGDKWIAERLLGSETEATEISGTGTASYQTGDAATSFDFSTLGNGLKEEIEIEGPSQPNAYRFELTASAGLTPTQARDGSIEFRDEHDELAATLPAPVVADSAKSSPSSAPVDYKLERIGQNQWQLSVEVDLNWLAQPERSWPVRIDPTITVPSPSLDCWFDVHQGESSPQTFWACGSGGTQKLYAKSRPQIGALTEQDRSALRFNLESIPANAYIAGATVGLYAPSAASNTSGVEVLRATKSWTNQVNWFKYNGNSSWAKEGGDFTEEGATILTSERGARRVGGTSPAG